MGRCHVRIDRGVPAAAVVAHMTGDTRATMEELNRAHRQPAIDLRAGEAIRHRVVVADELDVIVDADPDDLPLGELVTVHRQGQQSGPIEFDEGRLAAAGQLLERPVICSDAK